MDVLNILFVAAAAFFSLAFIYWPLFLSHDVHAHPCEIVDFVIFLTNHRVYAPLLALRTHRRAETETHIQSFVRTRTLSSKAGKHFKVFFVFHCRCRRGVLAVLSHTANTISIAKTTTVPTNDNIFVAFNLIIICGGAHTLTFTSHSRTHSWTDMTVSVSSFSQIQSTHLRTDFSSGTFYKMKKKSRCCWANTFFGSFKFVHSTKRECVCLVCVCMCVCLYVFMVFFPSNFSHFNFISNILFYSLQIRIILQRAARILFCWFF